jgi:hypothetical protein
MRIHRLSSVPAVVCCTNRDPVLPAVAGYSAPDRTLLIVDPFETSPGIRAVGFAELDRIWNSRAVGSNLRAAVFRRPKQYLLK